VKTVAVVTDLWPSATEPAAVLFVRDERLALGRLGYRSVVMVPKLVAPRLHRRIWGGTVNGAQRGWGQPPPPHLLCSYRNLRIPRGTELHVRSGAILRAFETNQVAPELVHGHFLLHAGTAAARVADRLSVPFVLTLHGTDYRVLIGSFPVQSRYRAEMLAAARAADRILVVDEGMVDGLVTAGVSRSAIDAIPMGVDDQMFTLRSKTAVRRQLGIRDEAAVVLFVGRPTAEKGFDLLEGAVARLGNVDCFAAGPPRASSVVTPLGVLSRDRLALMMAAADVVCLPSFAEGTPVALEEALASGTPVVATRVGGIPRLVRDQVAGILIDAGDELALTESLRDALTRTWDRAAIRATSEPYWWSQVAPKVARIYDELLRSVADTRGASA
jgi:teichuronic acid biosynthesis glycosyltransferase TuaC